MTLAQAQAELDTIIANWYPRFPDNYEPATKFGASFYAFHDQVVGGMRTALVILSGAVAVVLMIACANLTTMLLARAGALGEFGCHAASRGRVPIPASILGAAPWLPWVCIGTNRAGAQPG